MCQREVQALAQLCNKGFKNSINLKRHIHKLHAYKDTNLVEVTYSETQEGHSEGSVRCPMNNSDSNDTDLSDPGGLLELIGDFRTSAELSSELDKEDDAETQSVCDKHDIEEISKIGQEEEGRTFRKHTNLSKVFAPIKRKPVADLENFYLL